jgi:hypothetical protein
MEYKSLVSGFEDSARDPNLSVVYEDNVRSTKEVTALIVWFVAVYCGAVLAYSILRLTWVDASLWVVCNDSVEALVSTIGLLTAYLGQRAVKDLTPSATYWFAVSMHCVCPLFVASQVLYYCLQYRRLLDNNTDADVGSATVVLVVMSFAVSYFVMNSRELYGSVVDYLKAKRLTEGSYRPPMSVLYK